MRLFALLLALGLAWGQRLEAPWSLEGPPGAYLTLGVGVEGQGALVLSLEAPEEVRILSPRREIVVEGRGRTSFTLRVPEAQAGTLYTLTLRLEAAGAERARLPIVLKVQEKTELALSVPPGLEAQLGAPYEFPLYVTNRSNHPVEVQLSQTSRGFVVALDPPRLALEPGASRTVMVRLRPEGEVSPGYRFYLRIRAEAAGRKEAREVGVVIPFTVGTSSQPRGQDPQLTLALGLGVGLGYTSQGGLGYSFSLAPSLSGAFSDYVTGSLESEPFRNTSLPSALTLRLRGEGWEARLAGGQGGYQASGGLRLGEVRLSLEGRASATGLLGAAVQAVSQVPGLDLQAQARTQATPQGRQDNLGVRYRLPLEGGLVLGLGVDLAGFQQEGYTLGLALSQSLAWQAQDLDLLQSYSGVPLAGLHTLGLSGGTRSLYPFGVRAGVSYQLSPLQNNLQANLTLFAQPLEGLGLALTGLYRQAPTPGFGLSPRISLAFRSPGQYSGNLSFGLTRLWKEGGTEDAFQAGVNLILGSLQIGGGAAYTPAGWEGSISLRYPVGFAGFLQAGYTLKGREGSYQATWGEVWPGGWGSEVGYRYTPGQGHRFSLALGQRNFLFPGLGLGVSYALSLTPEPSHAFGLTLGYTLVQVLDTPEALVDLFGGRKVGEVRGRVFLDANLNGQQDPGEEPLGGFSLCLGRVCTPVAQDGTYRLLTPPAEEELRLVGAPALLGLFREERVKVGLNQSLVRDLPLAPVAQAEVFIFNDANHNGQLDPGEVGIPYAGVLVEGPVSKKVRVGLEGQALVGGLVQGTYRVRPDPDLLPPGYQGVLEATLEVDPKAPPAPVRVAAAPPKRTLEVTYRTGGLAVVAKSQPAQAVAGGEVEVVALVEGRAAQVTVEMEGKVFPLKAKGPGTYTLRLRTPRNPGLRILTVRAQRDGEEAEAQVFLTLLPGPLFTLSETQTGLRIQLPFRAQSLVLVLEGGRHPLKSSDGYTWEGRLPLPPGRYRAQVVADGETLGEAEVVQTPETQAQEP